MSRALERSIRRMREESDEPTCALCDFRVELVGIILPMCPVPGNGYVRVVCLSCASRITRATKRARAARSVLA